MTKNITTVNDKVLVLIIANIRLLQLVKILNQYNLNICSRKYDPNHKLKTIDVNISLSKIVLLKYSHGAL